MCLNPQCRKIIGTDGKPRMLHYNCGKCLECVATLQRHWSVRLAEECKQWKTCMFFTLKYCNERVPHSDVVLTADDLAFVKERYSRLPVAYSPKYQTPEYEYARASSAIPLGDGLYCLDALVPDVAEIQRFWKRVRKAIESHGYKLKYFLCSEYGPKTLRPHYHGIVFTDAPLMYISAVMFQKWSMVASVSDDPYIKSQCFNSSRVKSPEACGKYVSKYCCKPAEFEHPLCYLGLIPKPFRLMSKGLGIAKADELREKYVRLMSRYKLRPQYIDVKKHICIDPNIIQKFNLPAEFYAGIKQIFSYVVKTPSGNYLNCSYPRYWRDRVFPQRLAVRKVYDDSGTEKDVYYTCKDADHPISQGYASYISDSIREQFDTRLYEFLALHPDISPDTAIIELCHEDRLDMQQRYTEALSRFRRFYEKTLF